MSHIKSFELEGKKIGSTAPCLVIAEVAQAHDGSLGMAHAFIDAAAKAGIKAIVQPGGSIRDEEVIEACDEHGIAMIFVGVRHFKH